MISHFSYKSGKMDLNSCLIRTINTFTAYPTNLSRIKARFPPKENVSVSLNEHEYIRKFWSFTKEIKNIKIRPPIYLIDNPSETKAFLQYIKVERDEIPWRYDDEKMRITGDDYSFLYENEYIDYVFDMDYSVVYELCECERKK